MTLKPPAPKKTIVTYATRDDLKKVAKSIEITSKNRQEFDSLVRKTIPKDAIILDILDQPGD